MFFVVSHNFFFFFRFVCLLFPRHTLNSYEVLSDKQERAWYDSHRDSILRGNDGGGIESNEFQASNGINLCKFSIKAKHAANKYHLFSCLF